MRGTLIGGFGLAILSNLLVKDETENKMLRVIPISNVDLERNICLVYHKDKYLSDQIRQLIRSCGE